MFVGAAALGVLIYYWTVFSGRIDNLLAGEVFTRSAGIYAAPKQLRVNETISRSGSDRVFETRGLRGESTTGRQLSRPLHDQRHDRRDRTEQCFECRWTQQFLHVRVQFNGSGKAISSLYDLDNRSALERRGSNRS